MACKGFTKACLINRKNPIRPAHLLSRLFKTLILFHICKRTDPVGQWSEAEDQIHHSFSFFRSLNMKTYDKLWHMHPLQRDDLKIQDLANKGTIEKACGYCKESIAYLCAVTSPVAGGCSLCPRFSPVVQQLLALSLSPSPNQRLNMAFPLPLALIILESEKARLHPPGTSVSCWWAAWPDLCELSTW